MARSIPAAITTALGQVVKQPAASVIVRDVFDRPFGSATGGASGRSAIIGLTDGGYLRAYVSQPGLPADATVYSQVISNVADPLQLGAWVIRASNAAMQAGVCLALYGTTIYLLYQRRSDYAVCYQTSGDGVTWTAETVASSPGVRVWALASASVDDLFQAQNAIAGDDSVQTVSLLSHAGGSFSTVSAWTNPSGLVRGLSAVYAGGSYKLALGAQSRPGGSLALCVQSYAAGAWSSLTPIHPIDDPDTGFSIPYPTVAAVAAGYRVAAEIYDSGLATGTVEDHCEMWTSPDFVHWSLEQTLSGPHPFGASICPVSSGGWLVADAGGITRSTVAAGHISPAVDVSSSLLSLRIDEPANGVATGEAVLDNHDGRFQISTTPTTALRAGAQVLVALGYGSDSVTTHTLWIDRLDATNAVGVSETAGVILHLSSRARRLERPVGVERVYAGAGLLYLTSAVAVGGGLPAAPASPGTLQFAQTIDSFAVSATASWRAAFDRLAGLFGFDWFLDENEVLRLREPSAGDTPDFSYGSGTVQTLGHQISPRRRPNHVRVAARPAGSTPAFAESNDFTGQASTGEVVTRRVVDRLLASSAQAQIRSDLELRRAQRAAVQGWARLPLNPSHQPLDVIAIADESLTAILRIERITWLVDMNTGAFEQRVELAGV